jgi:hypothetical protein
MNLHEAVRKHYGDGNLKDLRLFVQLGEDSPRRVSIVNKGGLALRSSSKDDSGRALYKGTRFHVYKASRRINSTVLYAKELPE